MVSVCNLSGKHRVFSSFQNNSFKMKSFMVALSFFTVAATAPTNPDPSVEARRRLPALEHEEIHDEYGQFALRYVTVEGTVVSERGRLVPSPDGTGYVMILEGEVSYVGDDGQTYVTKYSAGTNGTHVEGNHLPVSVTTNPILEPMIRAHHRYRTRH